MVIDMSKEDEAVDEEGSAEKMVTAEITEKALFSSGSRGFCSFCSSMVIV
jgi:hypothetical protein